MRVHVKLKNDTNYSAKIVGALAAWDNKDARLSRLTLFGHFPLDGELVDEVPGQESETISLFGAGKTSSKFF